MRHILLTCLLLISSTIYSGEWITNNYSGCKVWVHNPKPNEIIVYQGECVDGKANGKGLTKGFTGIENGPMHSFYFGEYKNGKEHGKGNFTLYHKNGMQPIVYEGEYKDGKEHGEGSLTWYKDGKILKKYEGSFIDGSPHGEGTQIDENGNKYVGSFQNGKRHGVGEITFPTGNSYKGLWENGERIKVF